jgi:hypothetical protein
LWGLLGSSTRKTVFFVLAVLLAFMIGISRIYLGSHFTSDVVAGWAVGGLFLILFIRLEGRVTAWVNRLSINAALGVVVLGTLLVVLMPALPGLLFHSWPIPQAWVDGALAAAPDSPIDPLNVEGAFTLGGLFFGFFLGALWLYRRAGGYTLPRGFPNLFLSYALGLAGVMVLRFGLDAIFPDTPDLAGYAFRFLRYALIGTWISLFAPLLFRRLKLSL